MLQRRSEHRKTARHAMHRAAEIIIDENAPPIRCKIRDISEGGARLALLSPVENCLGMRAFDASASLFGLIVATLELSFVRDGTEHPDSRRLRRLSIISRRAVPILCSSMSQTAIPST
jgi:hypothetical protein